MNEPCRTRILSQSFWCGACVLGLAALAGLFLSAIAPLAGAAQVRAVNIALRHAIGRVVFCVTKDTIVVAAVDGGASAAAPEPGGAPPRAPAIVPLGGGRIAVVLGATDWTRDEAGTPVQLDQELPALVRKVLSSMEKADPLNPSADDVESIGLTLLEFVRPFVTDIHYKLDLPADEPLIQVLLAGYTDGYGPEIWDLRYRVQQRNLGSDYWDTRPMRPSYVQLYPPEKGKPRTFVESQYPAGLMPLGLARAAQSDVAVSRIRSASSEINAAVTAILNGESTKAATRPAEDFLRLAIPALAGPQAKLSVAALDQQHKFQWLLAPENLPAPPPAPEETNAQPGKPVQTERPSLRRAGPPTTQ